jgi:hypothetical protein
MSMLTILDIAKTNGVDAVTGLIDETIKAHPELTLIPSRTIRGINYKTLVRTALGTTTAGFRSINAGVADLANVYENRLVEAFPLEARWTVDKALADSYEDGAAALLALEAAGVMEGQMQGLAAQFYYGTGTGGNSAGHPGLINAYDSTNMVIDAGGTTATTGSSVWILCAGPTDVQWVWGNAGQLELTPAANQVLSQPTLVVDSNDSTKKFLGYSQTLSARVGLQVGSTRSVVRIKKLTEDSGKGLTDSLIAQALALLPVGKVPTVMLMNRRSRRQLQVSRSVTISASTRVGGGVGNVADLPTEAFGIPIAVTDAISSTEALTL